MLYKNLSIDCDNDMLMNVKRIKSVRTKKAWKKFYKRHKDWCVVSVPAQYGDEEQLVSPKAFVYMMIKNGDLTSL